MMLRKEEEEKEELVAAVAADLQCARHCPEILCGLTHQPSGVDSHLQKRRHEVFK